MSDVLKQAGIYDEFIRSWMLETRFMKRVEPHENMDWFRDRVWMAWALVANMEDSPEKLYRLQLLQRATSIGIAKIFTPDGGAIHHNCDHLSYSWYSAPTLISLVGKVQQTHFPIRDDVIEGILNYARVRALATVCGMFPGNLSVRLDWQGFAFGGIKKTLERTARTAPAAEKELMGLYLRMPYPTTAKKPFIEKLDAQNRALLDRGFQPAPPPKVHFSYNIQSAAIHRRGDWVVSIKGNRIPFKGIEMYTSPGAPRTFMRNACMGSIQIYREGLSTVTGRKNVVDSTALGYDFKGWDVNHFPGVTAPVKPWHELTTRSKTDQVRNQSTFAGGTSLGPNGIWGMIVRPDAAMPEACRKSAFCFDHRITMLTSDIVAIEKTSKTGEAAEHYPIHTTVFQFLLDPSKPPIELQSTRVAGFPFSRELQLDAGLRLKDHLGNGYYVHPCTGSRLHVKRSVQKSYSTWNWKDRSKKSEAAMQQLRASPVTPETMKEMLQYFSPYENDYSTAYIFHDSVTEKPAQAAFTIFVQDDAAQGELPYEILRQDRIAHILRDKVSRVTGYVVFEPKEDLGVGVLRQVNRPSAVMLKEAPSALVCSVSATDVEYDKRFQGKQSPGAVLRPVTLTFNGVWRLGRRKREDIASTIVDESTVITIPYRNYMPVIFHLEKVD